jgi:hypothetical protein
MQIDAAKQLASAVYKAVVHLHMVCENLEQIAMRKAKLRDTAQQKCGQ